MSVNYWIGATCPWCHGRNGEHADDCKFINRVVLDKKPLRWRTGPVPEGEIVLYEYFLDGLGTDYEIGEGNASGDLIGNFHTEWKNARWLPLSEILAATDSTLTEADGTPWKGEHCQQCGRPYASVWAVDDETWVKVTGKLDGSGLFCMECFEKMAAKRDVSVRWKAEILALVEG